MKRGHILLISGGVLIVAGIIISAVWGVSFAGSFLRENTLVGKTTIDGGKSLDTKTVVNQLDRPVSVAIGVDHSGLQPLTLPSDATRLKETVTDPNGKIVSSNEFGESFFTSFTPGVAGIYTVTISNLGTKPVSISGAFGYMPFMGPYGNPNINVMMGGAGGLGMIVVGGGLVAAGVVTLIVGAVIAVVDSRAKSNVAPPSSTTTSEGGITYRKE